MLLTGTDVDTKQRIDFGTVTLAHLTLYEYNIYIEIKHKNLFT